MKVRCNQCMKVFDEDKIVYDGESDTEFCPECGESGCLMDLTETRYYVCGLGYDENDCVTDYEQYLGDFDTYEEAYEEFVRLQCRDVGWFFRDAPNVYQLLLQLEECEETEDETNCIDVKNEWWIINPNFKEEQVMSKKGNMAYWDMIDDITEEYVRKMLEMSTPSIELEYDDILALGKEITEFVVAHLQKEVGANFPYVDENY